MELEILQSKIDDLKAQRESANKKYEEFSIREKEITVDNIMNIANELTEKVLVVRQITHFCNYEYLPNNDMGFHYVGLKENNLFKLYSPSSEYTLKKEWLLEHKIEWLKRFKGFFINTVIKSVEQDIDRVLNDYSIETLRLERVVLGGK